MDVFNISEHIMCPAQKGKTGRQGRESREEMNKDPAYHGHRFVSNLSFLVL